MVTKGRELVAYFTWEGETPERGRKVSLSKTSGGYLISVRGFPELRKTFVKKSEAVDTFRSIHDASWKDWGASEIVWEEGKKKEKVKAKKKRRRRKRVKGTRPVKVKGIEIKGSSRVPGSDPLFRMLMRKGVSGTVEIKRVPSRKMLLPGRE